MALRLNKLGFHVIAGCLDPTSGQSRTLLIKCVDINRMKLVKLDVTNHHDVMNCLHTVRSMFNDGKLTLHALINNAGVKETLRAVQQQS